jgi:hypothetical protein
MKKLPTTDRFRFLNERSIKRDFLELTRYQSADLRSKLPKGIYWLQVAKAGLIQWNILVDLKAHKICVALKLFAKASSGITLKFAKSW